MYPPRCTPSRFSKPFMYPPLYPKSHFMYGFEPFRNPYVPLFYVHFFAIFMYPCAKTLMYPYFMYTFGPKVYMYPSFMYPYHLCTPPQILMYPSFMYVLIVQIGFCTPICVPLFRKKIACGALLYPYFLI